MKIHVILIAIIVSFSHIPATLSAPNHDLSLSAAEQITFSKNTLKNKKNTKKNLSFNAFGQRFDLVLAEKNDLMKRLSVPSNSIKLYAGKIKNKANSWARLSVINGEYSGAVFDGNELFLIDVGKNIGAAMSNKPNIKNAKTVIYKSADVSTHLNCANHDKHGAGFSYGNLLSDSVRSRHTNCCRP